MPGIFFRVPAILDGRYEVTAPRQRNDPDFPLRGYVRCETCGKPFTASWSKGRSDYYAYYHSAARGISAGWRIHQIVRTEYSLMGSSFVTKSSPSATAWAIRIRSNGSLCSIGSAANAVT